VLSSVALSSSKDDANALENGRRWDEILEIGRRNRGNYRQWVTQSGTLVAELLSVAGTDQVITMDLHDAQFQGFFNIPVENLFARPLLMRYIMTRIPGYKKAVVVSPDAGGAKRATKVADTLGMDFALIHKERRNQKQALVGNVAGKVAVLIDDLADVLFPLPCFCMLEYGC